MQLAGSLGGVEGLRPFLLTTPFEAWHGLLAETRFYGPLVWGTFSSRSGVPSRSPGRSSRCAAAT